MSRSYKNVCPKWNWVYSVQQVKDLYGISRNTISNWVKSGLRPSNQSGSQLFRGAELMRFHKDRTERSKTQLRSGEFLCFGCKAAVFPEPEMLLFNQVKYNRWMAFAVCSDCGVQVRKLLDETEYDRLKNCFETNTTLAQSDEYKRAAPVGIGKIEGAENQAWYPTNDSIIHKWQTYAGQYDPKSAPFCLPSQRRRHSHAPAL